MKRGEIIKSIREKRGLTQAQVAKISGVTSTQVSQVENDRVKNGKSFIAVCKALDVPSEVVIFLSINIDCFEVDKQLTVLDIFKQINEHLVFPS